MSILPMHFHTSDTMNTANQTNALIITKKYFASWAPEPEALDVFRKADFNPVGLPFQKHRAPGKSAAALPLCLSSPVLTRGHSLIPFRSREKISSSEDSGI